MDELQSVAVGVALGVVLVSVLAAYPGEPFDYDTNGGYVRSPATNNTTTTGSDISTPEAETEAEEKAIVLRTTDSQQRAKVEKLQELLGLEREKVHELVEQAKQQAIDGNAAPSNNGSSCKSYSAWLDRGFFSVVLGLLACALWRDYGINVLSVAAHLFPREADALAQVASVPYRLLTDLAAFWM